MPKFFLLLLSLFVVVSSAARPAEAQSSEKSSFTAIETFSSAIDFIRRYHFEQKFTSEIFKPCLPETSMAMNGMTELQLVPLIAPNSVLDSEPELKKTLDACLKKILISLGPYNELKRRDEHVGNRSETAGVGLELNPDFIIVSTIEGAPASFVDIRLGDKIDRIDGRSIVGLSLREVISLLRGKKDSLVTLRIERLGSQTPLEFTLVRQEVRAKSVLAKLVKGQVLYLSLHGIDEETVLQVKTEIDNLKKQTQEPIGGVILDLRFSQGGLLFQSAHLASIFLPPKALVMTVVGRANEQTKHDGAFILKAASREKRRPINPFEVGLPELETIPLVVLVGPRTASGAEIVAAALQDHRRALVLGEKTFAKGTVETLLGYPLERNSLG